MTKERLLTILQKIVLVIGAFFILSMFISQLFHSSLISATGPAFFFNSLIAITAFSLIWAFKNSKSEQLGNVKNKIFSALNSKKAFKIVILLVFVFSFFYLLIITPFPVQPDEGILLRTAHGGTDLIVNFNYVNVHPYQSGYMTLERFVWQFVHGRQSFALVILSLINAVSFAAIILFLKLYTEKINPEIKQLSINVSAIFIAFVATPAVANIYPNLLFLALSCAGVYCFLIAQSSISKKQYAIFALLTFLLFSFAGFIRPNTAIFVAAILVFCILAIFMKKTDKKLHIHIFKNIIIVILVILSSFASSGLSDLCTTAWAKHYGLQKSAPLDPLSTSIASGLNILKRTNPPGEYYEYTNPIYWVRVPEVGIPPYSNEAAAEIKKHSWKIVGENVNYMIQNPLDAASFFTQKFVASNSREDFGYFHGAISGQPYLIESNFIKEAIEPLQKYLNFNNPLISSARTGVIFAIICIFMKLFVFTVLAFSLIATLKLFISLLKPGKSAKKRTKTPANTQNLNSALLPIIIFIGGETYNLISETKPAYLLVYFIILLPVAACGSGSLLNKP